jgi:DNA-binding NarL/FixJ family response regulator
VPAAKTHRGRSSTSSRLADAEIPLALVACENRRKSIGALLREQGWRFSAFDSATDLLECDAASDYGLVALWAEDADASAAQQVDLLRRSIEHVSVVVICAAIQRWEVRAVLAGGAAGVAMEKDLDTTLGACLQAALAGQICVPRQHWRQIEPPALSSREKQILGLVVMGYMNGQIAQQLFLAESTVKSHLSSAFGKLGVRSRNEAVKLILDSEHGLGMGILALGSEPLELSTATP